MKLKPELIYTLHTSNTVCYFPIYFSKQNKRKFIQNSSFLFPRVWRMLHFLLSIFATNDLCKWSFIETVEGINEATIDELCLLHLIQ